MAHNRETLLLLIDVGPSMHSLLPEVGKLVHSKCDEVGIVLFGIEDVRVVDGDMVYGLQKLPRGTVPGDFLDAVVVGTDMLIKKYEQTSKGKKRLCLIANAQSPIKEPYEGTKEDQVSIIAAQMDGLGMKMDSAVLRGKLGGSSDEKFVRE